MNFFGNPVYLFSLKFCKFLCISVYKSLEKSRFLLRNIYKLSVRAYNCVAVKEKELAKSILTFEQYFPMALKYWRNNKIKKSAENITQICHNCYNSPSPPRYHSLLWIIPTLNKLNNGNLCRMLKAWAQLIITQNIVSIKTYLVTSNGDLLVVLNIVRNGSLCRIWGRISFSLKYFSWIRDLSLGLKFKASESTQLVWKCFFLSLSRNCDDQLSLNVHRFVILCIILRYSKCKDRSLTITNSVQCLITSSMKLGPGPSWNPESLSILNLGCRSKSPENNFIRSLYPNKGLVENLAKQQSSGFLLR